MSTGAPLAPPQPPATSAVGTSVGDRVSGVSLAHIMVWAVLFTAITLATVVLLNWFLRRGQQQRENARAAGSAAGAGDEAAAPTSVAVDLTPSSASTKSSEGIAITGSRESSPPNSSGNLHRQRFIEKRKANTSYGATDSAA